MLQSLFRSRLRAKLLSHLFSNSEKRFFARQLETSLGESQGNISRELARLESLGIVFSEREGRQKFFRANRDCPIYLELRGMVIKTSGLADILKEALSDLASRIDVAFIYGSFASGEERKVSDVDLFIVGKVTFGEVVSALAPAEEKLSREVNPSVYPRDEFRRKLSSGNHFLRSILTAPKVFLIGNENAFRRLGKEGVAD